MTQSSITRTSLLNALPDFGLGLTFIAAWIAPGMFGNEMVSNLLLVMMMEFVILHSSAFMGVVLLSGMKPRKKSISLVGIGLLYSSFVVAFSYVFGSWWPVIAFWGMIFNRLQGVLMKKPGPVNEKIILAKSWVVGMICYLGFVMVTSIVPLPAFGVTSNMITGVIGNAGGSWVEEPQTVLAFGFLYFCTTAYSELYNHAWLRIPGGFRGVFQRLTKNLPPSDSQA